jgi:hypothetical protein
MASSAEILPESSSSSTQTLPVRDLGGLLLAWFVPEGADDLLQAVADGRVGERHFLLHVCQLAFAAHEGLDEIKLFGCKTGKGGIGEAAFDDRVTGFTAQPGDGQFTVTDRAFTQGCFHNLQFL